MADYRLIMSLLLKGRSYREVVAAAGCSHRDVSAAKAAIRVHEITAGRLGVMSEDDLAGLFPDGRSRVSAEYEQPDFARVARSMKANRHFTLLQAWRAYAAASTPLRRYGYAQYCHLFGEFAVRNDLVAVLHHEPGRAMLADWAGDTIALVDAVTGEVPRAYLFLAVLPFSAYVFCRAFTDMRMEAWIAAHVAAFEFIGGTVQILVPDNATTATHRKARGDAARFVTDRYRQMADHYGVAVVPARVRKPRDKAAVESGVNVVNKRVIGYLAEETWTTLAELNDAIDERVFEINHEIRRADGTTRFELFSQEEAPALAPLPGEVFEQVEWKEVKAQRNYHVTTGYQHYSIPYRLAGRLLRLRLTSSRVTVFDGQQIVAEHVRKTGRKGQYSTDPAHVPPQHRNIAGLWSRTWFLDRARTCGPATVKVIEQLLDRYQIEAQGYLDCQNILESLGRRSTQRLEAACQALLNMGGHPSYSTLKRLITAIDSDQKKPAPFKPAASTRKPAPLDGSGQQTPEDVLVRGAGYYRDGR